MQDRDDGQVSRDELSVVTERQPTEQEWQDLLFAWKVAKFVKSNAIIYAAHQRTIGVGAGQMSRVNSARIAAIKAEHASLEVKGAVMGVRRILPLPRRYRQCRRAGHCGSHSAGRFDSRRRGDRSRQRRRHGNGLYRHAPLPPLIVI